MTESDWPFSWDGIVESVTSTPQPDGRWAVAALGIRGAGRTRRARTWGDTRTRQNLARTGEGFVQLVPDPVAFARAALGRWSRVEPILPEAAAWIEIEATRVDDGCEDGTDWTDWSLRATESEVCDRQVPVPNRAQAAVIEMTVAASRLGVVGYERQQLLDRLEYFAVVARRCGGYAEREAVDWIERVVEEDEAIAQWDGGDP